jgi:hypothetical protein
LNDRIEIYYCPKCKRDLAAGRLVSLKAICSFCKEFIIMDTKDGLHTANRVDKKTYGRALLTIKQMQSSKAAALSVGDHYYFSGQPCRNGHIAPRNKKGECHECCRVWREKYVVANQDKIKAAQRRFAEKKKAKRIAAKLKKQSNS